MHAHVRRGAWQATPHIPFSFRVRRLHIRQSSSSSPLLHLPYHNHVIKCTCITIHDSYFVVVAKPQRIFIFSIDFIENRCDTAGVAHAIKYYESGMTNWRCGVTTGKKMIEFLVHLVYCRWSRTFAELLNRFFTIVLFDVLKMALVYVRNFFGAIKLSLLGELCNVTEVPYIMATTIDK